MFSKRRASGGGPSGSVSGGNIEYMAELSSYKAACRVDPEIENFDNVLQQRTSRVISNLAVNVQRRSLSFDTLTEVAGSLFDMNQDVVRIILDCKKDILKNPEMFQFVDDYFESSIRTIDFFTALEKCLKKARNSQLIVQLALQAFDEEYAAAASAAADKEEQSSEESRNIRYGKTLEELRHFNSTGDPFTDEFKLAFQLVYQQQLSMLEKLHHRKNELNKKLKSIKTWRKVTCIIFASAFAALLICSVVASLVATPPIAAALAAASSVPLDSMRKWFDSIWKNYQDALEAEKELINTMHVGTFVVLTDLDSIRILVNRLEDHIRSMLEDAEFAFRDEETVRLGIEEIRKKMGLFMKSIEDLVQQADRCSRDIKKARTVVLQRIIKHP